MLLFKKPFHEGLASGTITLTFRRWAKPHVRVGGRYRCHPIGVLEVDDVRLVAVSAIDEADAKAAGFATRELLVAYLAELGPLEDATPVYRVRLHHGGDGDRVSLALEATLSSDDVADLVRRLARFDANGAWTAATMAIIDANPRVAASKLAAELGRETLPFKTDVRKLKKLGLTQSFEVGYEISPRGRAYLEATTAAATGLAAKASKTTRATASKPAKAAKASKLRRRLRKGGPRGSTRRGAQDAERTGRRDDG